jgi:hypothetical protein
MTDNIVSLRPLSVEQVATVALGVDKAAIEQFVADLSLEQVAEFVVRIEEARARCSFAAKLGEARLAADGYVGHVFTDPETHTKYRFDQDYRKKFTDIPGMADALMKEGVSLDAIWRAVSDMRVTDLRNATRSLDAERSANALDVIEEFRAVVKSAPGFIELDANGKPAHR